MTSRLAVRAPQLDAACAARVRQAEVVVLAGGVSGEREVSLLSGAEIARALGVADGRGPARVRLVQIDADGSWGVEGRRYGAAEALAQLGRVDVFLIALHGGAGENGTLQGLLESVGARYTGSGVAASALCMDKLATRALARDAGLRVARGACFPRSEVLRDAAPAARAAQAFGERGWFVKPRSGGSSVATFRVAAGGDLTAALRAVAESGDDVLVEEALSGVECSCGVLEGPGAAALALPAIEIQPAAGHFFDYRQKYASDGAREVCPPPSLSLEAHARVQRDALALFAVTGCSGYARIDFIVSDDGVPVLLEANTLPGLTARSLLPQEAAAVGMDYRSLCLWILGAALRERGARAP
jgi:D-alanine-D-alanine ligase